MCTFEKHNCYRTISLAKRTSWPACQRVVEKVCSVITSYSIHYTKLYEGTLMRQGEDFLGAGASGWTYLFARMLRRAYDDMNQALKALAEAL